MSDDQDFHFDADVILRPFSDELTMELNRIAMLVLLFDADRKEYENEALVSTFRDNIAKSVASCFRAFVTTTATASYEMASRFEADDRSRKTLSDKVSQVIEINSRLAQQNADLIAAEQLRLVEHHPSSPVVREKVLSLTDGKCAYCNSEITRGKADGLPEFVIEHVVPKSCGGPDHMANYVPACSKCNSQKASGHVLDFIRKKSVA